MSKWVRCTGVVYEALGRPVWHVLCYQHANRSGLCKRHRQTVADGRAVKPTAKHLGVEA